jgi:hypothetical protein
MSKITDPLRDNPDKDKIIMILGKSYDSKTDTYDMCDDYNSHALELDTSKADRLQSIPAPISYTDETEQDVEDRALTLLHKIQELMIADPTGFVLLLWRITYPDYSYRQLEEVTGYRKSYLRDKLASYKGLDKALDKILRLRETGGIITRPKRRKA